MKLIIPKDIPDDFKGNGCGSEGWLGKLVPEEFAGFNMSQACAIHDYMFEVGGNQNDFDYANAVFLHNMMAIIDRDDTWLLNEDKAMRYALVYYKSVVEFGSKFFNWKG